MKYKFLLFSPWLLKSPVIEEFAALQSEVLAKTEWALTNLKAQEARQNGSNLRV